LDQVSVFSSTYCQRTVALAARPSPNQPSLSATQVFPSRVQTPSENPPVASNSQPRTVSWVGSQPMTCVSRSSLPSSSRTVRSCSTNVCPGPHLQLIVIVFFESLPIHSPSIHVSALSRLVALGLSSSSGVGRSRTLEISHLPSYLA